VFRVAPTLDAGYTFNAMKSVNTSRIMIFFVSLALVLLAAFAVLFVQLEVSRRHSGMEYQVFQIMTSIADIYNIEKTFDPALWPDVSGFGVYVASGTPVYRYGTAPESILNRDRVTQRGITTLSGTSMTILKRMGVKPSTQPVNPSRMSFHESSVPPDFHRAPDESERDKIHGEPLSPDRLAIEQMSSSLGSLSERAKNRYVFIDINVASFLREGSLVMTAAFILIVAFFCIISLVFVFFRKLEKYRTRERETAHLVQLGEAARTLAHEIKNPLGVIRVQCATLRRTVPAERIRNIDVIEEETARLTLLADRVRDFLKSSLGNPREYSAEFFLERCRERYAGKITVSPADPPSATVCVDSERMTQIIDNLLANAIEASDGASELPELSLAVHRDTVSFIVADRGCGVAVENRSRLFEPFFTTKSRGSGIGLALARRFAEQAGGSLAYSPRPDGGSTFTLNLPKIKDFT